MNSERKLLEAIAKVEKKIQREQFRVAYHQQYFRHLVQKHTIFLTALLVSTFLIGWKKGKKSSIGVRFRQSIGLILISTLAYMRNIAWKSLLKGFQQIG